MNLKFGKLEGRGIAYAPDSLVRETGEVTLNPSDETYVEAGWLPVVDEPPAAEAGMSVLASGWKERDGRIVRTYKQVGSGEDAMSSGPRVFSKLKVVMALKAAGLWVLTKTWIEENGLYDYYLAAQDFSEGNEWFQRGRAELQRLANRTDSEIEAILAGCLADGKGAL